MELDRIEIAGGGCNEIQRLVPAASDCDILAATPRVIDLCCGLGGLSLAARQLGMLIVAGVDIGGDAVRTFSRNFPLAAAIKTTIGGSKAIVQCEG